MTTSMGIARGLFEVGGWDNVTHLSAISGGAWFASQFVHSHRFYDNLRDVSKPVDTIVTEWGKDFARAINIGIQSGRIDTTILANSSGQSCDVACHDVVKYVGIFIELFTTLAQYPVVDWAAYTAEQLAPFIPQPGMLATDEGARETPQRGGLQSATLIQGSALLYDSWVPDGSGGTAKMTATVDMRGDDETSRIRANKWPFPVAHVLPGPDTTFSGWHLSSDVREVRMSRAGGLSRPLELADAPVSKIAASSSAAFGLVSSPHAIKVAIKWAVKKSGLPPAQAARLDATISHMFDPIPALADACMPAALHNLAIPIKLKETTHSGPGVLPSTYRLADGVFGENNGIAFALARMQADCQSADAALDCPGGNTTTLWLLATDHAPAKALKKLPQPHDLNVIFADYPDPSRGGVVPDWRTVPATIFSDAFPAAADWHVYEGKEHSKFWYGELTTQANPYYGVEGGWKVRTLLLRPSLELGGVTDGSLGGGTQLFYGGAPAARFFEREYAPRAAQQAAAIAPVLRAFLEESTAPASSWPDEQFVGSTLAPSPKPPSVVPPRPTKALPAFYDGAFGHYMTALVAVICCYILLSLCGTSLYGWFMGRGSAIIELAAVG